VERDAVEDFYVDYSLGDDTAYNGMHWRPGGAGAGSGPFKTIAKGCAALNAIQPDAPGSRLYIRSHSDGGVPLEYTEEHGTSDSLGVIPAGDSFLGLPVRVMGYKNAPVDFAGRPILNAGANGLRYCLLGGGVDMNEQTNVEAWDLDLRGSVSFALEFGVGGGLTVTECDFAHCGGGINDGGYATARRCRFESITGNINLAGGSIELFTLESCTGILIAGNVSLGFISDHRGANAIVSSYGTVSAVTVNGNETQRSNPAAIGITAARAHACLVRNFKKAFSDGCEKYGCVADCPEMGGDTYWSRHNALGRIVFADEQNHDLRVLASSLGSSMKPSGWETIQPGACGTFARMPGPIDLGRRGRRS
jgi:hypothetical protein